MVIPPWASTANVVSFVVVVVVLVVDIVSKTTHPIATASGKRAVTILNACPHIYTHDWL